MKILCLLVLLLIATSAYAQEQQPGVNCVPIQGQGWQGCAPVGQPQQPQAPRLPPEVWFDHWGAIATDGPGGSFGASVNMSSRGDAENTALTDCQSKKGSSNCKVELSYINQCVAMVVGDAGHNSNVGPTPNAATQAAMNVCNAADHHCFAYYTGCSLPTRIQ